MLKPRTICVRSGCRADASEAAIILLPSNITVFTLDFAGSGLSGGEYVTLGWNEVSSGELFKTSLLFSFSTCYNIYVQVVSDQCNGIVGIALNLNASNVNSSKCEN